MPDLTKEQRFAVFLLRLAELPFARSKDEAFEQLSRTLNAVEDEFTDIPFEPGNFQTDGRMYPPQADSEREVAGRMDIIRFRSRGHNTFIRDNGAIEIRHIEGTVMFSKHGYDGLGVELAE
jgi:hypothetical protein